MPDRQLKTPKKWYTTLERRCVYDQAGNVATWR